MIIRHILALRQWSAPMRGLAAVLAVGALSGCADVGKARWDHSGHGPGKEPIAWAAAPIEEPLSAPELTARAALEAALARKGFRFTADAPVLLDMGVSDRPQAMHIVEGEGRTKSSGKKAGLLAQCPKRLVRLNVALLARAGGAPLYSASVQRRVCGAKADDVVTQLAEEMASAIAAAR